MKYILYLLLLVFNLQASLRNSSIVDIGVLSFRPVPENQKIWLPLGDKLHKYAPQYDFNITSYPQDELVKMIEQGIFDFAVVHPGVYVELETKQGVTNIASLVRQTKGEKFSLKTYGGVIATLASNKNINTLKDAVGKTIATTHSDGFAVMLLQREVFHDAGIDITKECKIIETNQPMKKVLQSLKNHKADIGFFRTGYIEELIEDGELQPDELKIINKIDDDYPYVHSTPLYPEWAVLATKKPNEKTVKAVTTALYQIHSKTNLDVHEFSIPLSYKSTRELMQKYHVYPFEKTPMSFKEIIDTYMFEFALILLFLAFGGIIIAIIYRHQMLRISKQAKQIATILATASDGIHVTDVDGNLFLFSDSFASMLGYSRKEISKLTVYDWDKNFHPAKIKKMILNIKNKQLKFETNHTKKDGTVFDVEIFARKIKIDNKTYIYASSRDITQRKKDEIKLLQHKTIFDSIAECVYAVDIHNKCNYINNSA